MSGPVRRDPETDPRDPEFWPVAPAPRDDEAPRHSTGPRDGEPVEERRIGNGIPGLHRRE